MTGQYISLLYLLENPATRENEARTHRQSEKKDKTTGKKKKN